VKYICSAVLTRVAVVYLSFWTSQELFSLPLFEAVCLVDRNLRDREFTKNSKTETRDLKFETETSKFVDFAEIFQKMCRHHFWVKFLSNFCHHSNLFRLFLTCRHSIQKIFELRKFYSAFLCDIQSLKTIGLWPRPVAFETSLDIKQWFLIFPARETLFLKILVWGPSSAVMSLANVVAVCEPEGLKKKFTIPCGDPRSFHWETPLV